MCGIAGLLDTRGAPANRGVLLRMLRRIEHRGPDGGGWMEDDGVSLFLGDRTSERPLSALPNPSSRATGRGEGLKVALGHQRLAITDLSEAGRQPMSRGDGRWWIVFNGAIYNAPELRTELEGLGQHFSTSTDTEVLLAAYVAWGPAALERFNGMWAFAIWDADRRELFCARDRFAVKPFYYTTAGSLFAFASEPKALRPVRPAEPNVEFAREYLATGATNDGYELTCYAGFRCLPPGSSLRIDSDGTRIDRWYDLDRRAAAIEAPGTLPEAAARLRDLLVAAVGVRLRADVPIGLLLSGGVDSSAIAGILRRHGANERFARQTLSTRYPELPAIDESSYVRDVLRATGFSGSFIEPSAKDFDEELDRVVESVDALVPSTIFYAQWLLFRAARKLGLPVMLGGQGSDELFGGYEPWDVHCVQLWNRRERFAAAREGILSGRRRWGILRGARHTLGVLRTAARPLPCGCSIKGSLQQHQKHLLTFDYLPGLLAFEDRDSMAWGIETRLPFLDYRVVEFARSLPDRFLLRNGWTKAVLRSALTGLVPKSILRRPRKLGLPGPLDGPDAKTPFPAHDAWRRLVEGGFVEKAPYREESLSQGLRLRIRILDAWVRRCLGGDPDASSRSYRIRHRSHRLASRRSHLRRVGGRSGECAPSSPARKSRRRGRALPGSCWKRPGKDPFVPVLREPGPSAPSSRRRREDGTRQASAGSRRTSRDAFPKTGKRSSAPAMKRPVMVRTHFSHLPQLRRPSGSGPSKHTISVSRAGSHEAISRTFSSRS